MPTREEALAQLTAPGEPYELVRETQGGYEVRVFQNAPPTLGDLFADSRSDLPFFVYDDERYSYEEAHQAACRIGRLLVDRYGIGKGDRVAISMRNYPEWIMCFMAVTSIGGIAVGLNALWQPEEMEYGLIDSGAKCCSRTGSGWSGWRPARTRCRWRRSPPGAATGRSTASRNSATCSATCRPDRCRRPRWGPRTTR